MRHSETECCSLRRTSYIARIPDSDYRVIRMVWSNPLARQERHKRTTILIVDDDPQIRALLRRYLEPEGFAIDEAATKNDVDQAFRQHAYDLVLLDIILEHDSGLEIARAIRAAHRTPIIFITGKSDVVDRIVGLELGADDYIAKPFHLREILARIRCVLRRVSANNADASAFPGFSDAADCLEFEGWRFYPSARKLLDPDGSETQLTTGEYNLLSALAKRPQRPLSRDQLMTLIAGREWAPYDRAIDSQVRRLRKKLEPDPGAPRLIKTVRGVGYMFAAEVHAD